MLVSRSGLVRRERWTGWRHAGRLGVVSLVAIGGLSLASCVADPPPVIGAAVTGNGQATVSWSPPPGDNAKALVAYVVIPRVNGVALPPVRFNSTATSQVVSGLINGTTYTFQVLGINSAGNETAWSAASNAVTPAGRAIAAGYFHTCAVVPGGTVKCWGANDEGQLGDGTTTTPTPPAPVTVSGITDATTVASGRTHTCAVRSGGTVRCWGHNGDGQLGDGTTTTPTPPALVTVSGLTDATTIASAPNGSTTCARRTGGTVRCWGYGYGGTPVAVTGITDATTVAVGSSHACAVLAGGSVKCWGANVFGQLGDGTNNPAPTPVTVSGLTDATTVAANDFNTCARRTNGGVRCWGNNNNGQLGNNDIPNPSSTPVIVSGLTDATTVATGYGHSCARRTGGGVRCWGDNGWGQLGDPTAANPSPTPVDVSGLTDATTVATGLWHSCAVLASGTVKCWGYNGDGQLGDGGYTPSPTPVTVTGL
jgi:alpha-tubulin suppressor-like RCC1 family protein